MQFCLSGFNLTYKLDKIELLKQQIAFYKSYFDNVDVRFDYEGTDAYSKAISMVRAYEIENGVTKESPNYFKR